MPDRYYRVRSSDGKAIGMEAAPIADLEAGEEEVKNPTSPGDDLNPPKRWTGTEMVVATDDEKQTFADNDAAEVASREKARAKVAVDGALIKAVVIELAAETKSPTRTVKQIGDAIKARLS